MYSSSFLCLSLMSTLAMADLQPSPAPSELPPALSSAISKDAILVSRRHLPSISPLLGGILRIDPGSSREIRLTGQATSAASPLTMTFQLVSRSVTAEGVILYQADLLSLDPSLPHELKSASLEVHDQRALLKTRGFKGSATEIHLTTQRPLGNTFVPLTSTLFATELKAELPATDR